MFWYPILGYYEKIVTNKVIPFETIIYLNSTVNLLKSVSFTARRLIINIFVPRVATF